MSTRTQTQYAMLCGHVPAMHRTEQTKTEAKAKEKNSSTLTELDKHIKSTEEKLVYLVQLLRVCRRSFVHVLWVAGNNIHIILFVVAAF